MALLWMTGPQMPPSTVSPADVLLPVGPLLGEAVELDAFLRNLVDRVAATMEADRGTLYLLDPAREELFSRAAHLPEIGQIRLRLGQGVAGRVAQTGQILNVPNAQDHGTGVFSEIDQLTGYTTRSLLAAPLRDQAGKIFGVLQVLNRRGRSAFGDDDEGRFAEVTLQASRALEATSVYIELERARDQPEAAVGYFFNHVVGESAPMQALYRLVQKVAPTDATVLIRGESGTGKELIARALHVNSRRREAPFVKVDCAALPAALIENELFGHEKGAFTGADHRVLGKLETAQGGTLFIDELGELPLQVQGKLLRVLQDRELERLGGTQTVSVDVRILAATHRDLAQRVAEKEFREDLYYRVKVVEAVLPPLRERGAEDIERLARHFLVAHSRKHRAGRRAPRLSPAALDRLKSHRWPGNVRELEHCIESAVVLCDEVIAAEDLPLPRGAAETRSPIDTASDSGAPKTLAQVEKEHIERVLARCEGNQTAAAKTLGIGRNTLARKLRQFGLGSA